MFASIAHFLASTTLYFIAVILCLLQVVPSVIQDYKLRKLYPELVESPVIFGLAAVFVMALCVIPYINILMLCLVIGGWGHQYYKSCK
jgi:hypothetical protein